jgi:hypothetical protein
MHHLDALIAKVNQLPDLLDMFDVTWWQPCTPEAIAAVEAALGVRITGGFRDFLLRVGGGGLESLRISGIDPAAPLAPGFGGVYADTRHYRESSKRPLPAHLIVIERDEDDNEPFCLDTSRVIDGENPVVLFYHQSTGAIEPIAPGFTAFYAQYLEPDFVNAGLQQGEPSVEQTDTPLTAEESQHLESIRAWAKDHGPRESPGGDPLAPIQTLLDNGPARASETFADRADRLERLGIALGDALARALGLQWVMVEDEYEDRTLALRVPATRLRLYPQHMISRHLKAGVETVNVRELFDNLCERVRQLREELTG